MISLEMARKLKNAGLVWEPKEGDFFAYVDDGEKIREQWEIASTNIYIVSSEKYLVDELGGRMVFFGGGLCSRDGGCFTDETYCSYMNKTGFNPELNIYSVASWDKKLWLPRLDQLLAEIEKEGYCWDMVRGEKEWFRIGVTHKNHMKNFQLFHDCTFKHKSEKASQATAEALLWIYENKEVKAWN